MSRRAALFSMFFLTVSACGDGASDPTSAPTSTLAVIIGTSSTSATAAPTTTVAVPTTNAAATTTTPASDTGIWARTTAAGDGTVLVVSSHTSGITDRFGPGVYFVDFDVDIRSCGWSATFNDAGDGHLSAATISLDIRDTFDDDNWTGLVVRTFDAAGNPIDLTGADGFTVHVDC